MNEITVTVKDETGSKSTTVNKKIPTTSSQATEKVEPKSEAAKHSKKESQGLAVASMVATRTFSYVTSNVGKWTGNSRNQDTANNISSVANIGIAMTVNPYLGLAVAAFQIGTTAADAAYTNWSEGIKAQTRLTRAGYTSLNEIIGGRK